MSERRMKASCHCGALAIEVNIDLEKPLSRCNCSICTKTAVTTAILKPAALLAVTGESEASTYVKQAGTRYFCPKCGVHVFAKGYLEQIGGDFVSVNANTLEGVEPTDFEVVYFDGRHDNWMAGTRDKPWPTLGG